jgi:hypothetical protein
LSVDPLASKYPGISPYAYGANNPIMMIDPDGREPIPWYRRWFGTPRKAWQWYSTAGAYDATTFNSAAQYNTIHLKADAYQSIRQRHRYYEWTQGVLDAKGNNSKWFGAAALVTNWNAVGGADLPDGPAISSRAEAFLKGGNEFLFGHNIKNAKGLITNNGSLSGSFTDANGVALSFDGLSGKDLDYALVNFEQSLVQNYIDSYQQSVGSEEMGKIIGDVNSLFSGRMAKVFGSEAVNSVMNQHFDGGKSFDFGNYNHRVLLGQKLIDQLHE